MSAPAAEASQGAPARPMIAAANVKAYPYALDSTRPSFTVNSSEWMQSVLSDIYVHLEDRRPDGAPALSMATSKPRAKPKKGEPPPRRKASTASRFSIHLTGKASRKKRWPLPRAAAGSRWP